jgi:hypothetical protein
MLPHQQRVIDERDQLAERLDKLRAFIEANPKNGTVSLFQSLDEQERNDLQSQANYMTMYLSVLYRRIARFTEEAK